MFRYSFDAYKSLTFNLKLKEVEKNWAWRITDARCCRVKFLRGPVSFNI